MCKVIKFSESLGNDTSAYVFKSFGILNSEQSEKPNNVEKSKEDNIEKMRQETKQLREQADLIIRNAQIEAKKIIEKANNEAVSILNLSNKEGYKDGLALANRKKEEILSNADMEASNVIECARTRTDNIINELEDGLLDFSFSVARKIIDIELDRNDDVYISIIKKAVRKLKYETISKIIMNEDDLGILLNSDYEKVFENGRNNIQFTYESEMKNGDIIIETDRGSLDVSINSQLEKIKNVLVSEKLNVI